MKLAVLFLVSACLLVSCKTAEQNARLAELVKLSVSIAESRGAITSQDAADIRAAETIVLPPATATAPASPVKWW